jgi:hypothetical protein
MSRKSLDGGYEATPTLTALSIGVVFAAGIGAAVWWARHVVQQHAAQLHSCDQEVRTTKGSSTDLQRCLTTKGWDVMDAVKEANYFWVTHHR